MWLFLYKKHKITSGKYFTTIIMLDRQFNEMYGTSYTIINP